MSRDRLRIGVDLAPLHAHGSGIPVFMRQVLEGIAANRPAWSIDGFSWSGWKDARTCLGPTSLGSMSLASTSLGPICATGTRQRQADRQRRRARVSALALSLPLVSRSRVAARRLLFSAGRHSGLDFFYALNFLPPGPIGCPVLPVIHDLFHMVTPEMVHPARRHALASLPSVAKAAARVQCVSCHTADAVNRLLGIPADRLDVVYPAVRPEFFTPAEDVSVELPGLRPGSYWLAVGMAERRKNLRLLIEVISRFPRLCTPEHPLVVTGGPGWQKSEELPTLRKLHAERRIRHLGFVPLPTLVALYAQCTAFLMPSLDEGFGLPLAEAIAAGAPAIASDSGALPEISGGHAIHLGATDAGAWAEAMEYCLQEGMDGAATAAARAHIRKFSMEATARAAIASIEAF